MQFSRTTKAFYPDALLDRYKAAGTLPTDLQTISDTAYAQLLNAPSQGKVLDWSGVQPVAVDRPVVKVVPKLVSRAQAKIALNRAGLLDQIEALVAQTDRETQLAWNEALTFERSSPTVAKLAAALHLTSDQLDGLFVTAAGITP